MTCPYQVSVTFINRLSVEPSYSAKHQIERKNDLTGEFFPTIFHLTRQLSEKVTQQD